MYPAVVAWLHAGPLPWLALLVPKPGILYAVVLLACGAVFVHRVTKVGIGQDQALEALLSAAVGALVGTRAFYLVTRTRFWEMSPAQLVDGRQGTASWGAYLGAFLGLILYAQWRKYRVLTLTDAATSAGPLACVIGRWNCLLAGDDFGRVTTWWWGIRYPAGSLPWNAHRRSGLIGPEATWSLPVHPNQIVQSLVSLAVFIVSAYWYRNRQSRPHDVDVPRALRCRSLRPGILRDPAAGGADGLLSHSQYMCLAFIVSGAVLWWWQRRASVTPACSRPGVTPAPAGNPPDAACD
jgi:phosphatidylglycerol:prolipoprotein diacylglycerol transferase